MPDRHRAHPLLGRPATEDGPKYAALALKYQALVERLEEITRERIASLTLARWALRTTPHALAMFSQGRVILSNDRWMALNRVEAAGRWTVVGREPPSRATYGTLADVVIAESPGIPEKAEETKDVVRCHRAWDDTTVELRLERPAVAPEGALLAVVSDVSELLRLEASRDARRRAGDGSLAKNATDLAQGLAHDLGNTLRVLSMRLELLSGGGASPNQIESMRRISEECLQTLVRMRDISQLKEGSKRATCDVVPLLHDAVDLARSQFVGVKGRVRAVECRLVVTGALPRVRGDAVSIKQVLLNLLLNAREAMPRGGVVTVRARVVEGAVEIQVADSGPGIARDVLPRLFEPYFTTKPDGTGLGLWMAQELLGNCGGSLQAGNRREGGAVFTVTLKAVRAPRKAAKAKR